MGHGAACASGAWRAWCMEHVAWPFSATSLHCLLSYWLFMQLFLFILFVICTTAFLAFCISHGHQRQNAQELIPQVSPFCKTKEHLRRNERPSGSSQILSHLTWHRTFLPIQQPMSTSMSALHREANLASGRLRGGSNWHVRLDGFSRSPHLRTFVQDSNCVGFGKLAMSPTTVKMFVGFLWTEHPLKIVNVNSFLIYI